tara:strand:+ start:479 stop:700 length:222 start_codon:yes stop_codon:yes gene_type:complete
MKILDLHNIKHTDAEILVDNFILKNFTSLPIEIITGNSVDMQKIVFDSVNFYQLNLRPSHPNNLGSYIITNKI